MKELENISAFLCRFCEDIFSKYKYKHKYVSATNQIYGRAQSFTNHPVHIVFVNTL